MIDRKLGNNADSAYYRDARVRFERLKTTREFLEWKQWQLEIQNGKCAWCRRPLSKYFRRVHVDHALALYHGGTNDYRNLVLSHAKCNLQKWIRIDGVPQWIINKQTDWRSREERRELLADQVRLFREIEQEAHDEQLLDDLRWITD